MVLVLLVAAILAFYLRPLTIHHAHIYDALPHAIHFTRLEPLSSPWSISYTIE